MTYFELRLFKADGTCFRVDEFRKQADAETHFDKAVDQTVGFHKLVADEPQISKLIAHQIQLVERNDAMTWLTEHSNWAAA